MPIADRSYKPYARDLNPRFPWWQMVRQELRILYSTRTFFWLLMIALGHALLRLLQVIAFDILMADPNNPITKALENFPVLVVDESLFFDFLRVQSPLVFLLLIFSGSGMICNDFKNNLMEIYFSKPLSWMDYVAGKVLSLSLIGLGVTLVPGLGLLVLHNALASSWETFRETYWLAASISAYSSILVLPTALGVLCASALVKSQRYASVTVIIVLVFNMAFAGTLSDLLDKDVYLVFGVPISINLLGEFLFYREFQSQEVDGALPLLCVGTAMAIALFFVCLKARRAEVAM